MAKKKSGKAKKARAPADPVVKAKHAGAVFVDRVAEALDRGSYAGVQRLAASPSVELDEESRAQVEELVELTKVDPVQIGVAAFAIVATLLVAAISLTPADQAHELKPQVEQTD